MLFPYLLALAGLSCADAFAITGEAIELRNLGLAQLENEKNEEAEATFRELTTQVTDDPLPMANLAVALLRQQKNDEAMLQIEAALSLAPGRPDLLSIQAEILNWQGRLEDALAMHQRVVQAAPDTVDYLYALFDHATTLGTEEALEVADQALSRLAELRSDNLVVLRHLGEMAIRKGDRELASRTYLRLGQLLWKEETKLKRAYDPLMKALEEGDLAAARQPSMLLGNGIVSSAMFKAGRIELSDGLQGMPILRFNDEPATESFGDGIATAFAGSEISDQPSSGRGLAAVDLDGDGTIDIARTTKDAVELRFGKGGAAVQLKATGAAALTAFDIDNDADLDLVVAGATTTLWLNDGKGGFSNASEAWGVSGITTEAATFDFDSDGDLDLLLARKGAHADLLLNDTVGPLQSITERAMPPLRPRSIARMLARDLDRDGDTDLLVAHEGGVSWVDNQRHETFGNRTAPGGLRAVGAAVDAASGDFDNDGRPDLALVGLELTILYGGTAAYETAGGRFEASAIEALGTLSSVVTFDADNDGRLDLAVGGVNGIAVFAQRGRRFELLSITGAKHTTALTAADLDRDGDLDLLASGPAGLMRFDNTKGNDNCWLDVTLEGLVKGNDKNNVYGFGAESEIRAGSAYQFREVASPITHFGVGKLRQADLLRVVWNNGVPQNLLQPKIQCRGEAQATPIVEKQVLKGSCPFLYTWTGQKIDFVTDLLWGAPLGMPLARGVWNSFDPEELVRVDGIAPRLVNGSEVFDLRITEELWEAAYFDRVRLWAVDTPEDLEVSSNLRIVPGARAGDPVLEDRVLATADLRPVVRALDGKGRDVTARVQARDEIYADGYDDSGYQGISPQPWSFTFDLGEAPAAPLRLLFDGWIFPSDASLNIASSQRRDLDFALTRLEVRTAEGWQTLMDPMGFPAGKTKTMVIDTPPLPAGVSELRIVTSRWLHWDRIAWSTAPRDQQVQVVARLAPASAELAYRGFSAIQRQAPNAPHTYDYDQASQYSPWLEMTGRATRYGDVRELLLDVDDQIVVLTPGDEIQILFDANALPALEAGHRRTFFLESHGYDKDADRNTWTGDSTEPLPFRGMQSYPFPAGVTAPDTREYQQYLERWQTRGAPEATTSSASSGGD
jgi:Flp pilus assembly protein TadD